MSAEDSLVNVDLTYPATAKHITKERIQQFIMVRESPEDYAAVTEPFVKAIPTARLAWVKNILEKKVSLGGSQALALRPSCASLFSCLPP